MTMCWAVGRPRTTTSSRGSGAASPSPDAVLARVREDRLLRWSLYASVPVLWLAIALVNPLLLMVAPLNVLALWTSMRYGILERHDPVEDTDSF